ncbi:MAG: AAA family ATPase, partial [Candidatus Nanoarchaeia archaeon]
MKALLVISDFHDKLMNEFHNTIIGYKEEIRLTLAGLLAKGHILLEGVPGIAKTTIAKALAKALNLREEKGFKRVQCTPDLMPADVVGTLIYDPKAMNFRPHFGPVFTNFLLVDEINRAVPRTQSALLQAMQEKEVTIGGTTYTLDEPFFVIATQNPIEQEGTYPLPEAQLDRFIMKVKMGYPETFEDEIKVLDLHEMRLTEPVEEFETILDDPLQICDMQLIVAEKVAVPPLIKRYIAEIIRYTRVREEVSWGSSPRAGIFLMKSAKAYATLSGRNIVQLEDVDNVAYAVL